MIDIEYIGCFFEVEDVKRIAEKCSPERLSRVIASPHVTFAYRPEHIPCELFGTPVSVRVVGYGRNEENEAFSVEFSFLPESLEALAQKIKIPHITVSVSKGGKPVNSNKLEFTRLENSFILKGVFGGKGSDGFVYTDCKAF